MTAPASTEAPRLVTCSLCGTRFDAHAALACASCPLGARCALACCPSCGYSSIDGDRSSLVGLARRLSLRLGRRRNGAAASLATCRAGSRVLIDAVDALPAAQREQLAAYGIAPGRTVDVLQTSPVTVVRCDHLELAFEARVARAIAVAPS